MAGHTAVLGADGTLIIVVRVRLRCPCYLARPWSNSQLTSSLYYRQHCAQRKPAGI